MYSTMDCGSPQEAKPSAQSTTAELHAQLSMAFHTAMLIVLALPATLSTVYPAPVVPAVTHRWRRLLPAYDAIINV